ncbi:MAG TPA: hypothetical protein VFY92_02680 [Hyphomicrobiaceae bacterium]|nr:hypothetical protein [Hyphomicrobiaceae bacterium]
MSQGKGSRGRGDGRVVADLRLPLLLGVTSGCWLVLAFVGDGAWDAASWLLLAAPIAAVAGALLRPGAARRPVP